MPPFWDHKKLPTQKIVAPKKGVIYKLEVPCPNVVLSDRMINHWEDEFEPCKKLELPGPPGHHFFKPYPILRVTGSFFSLYKGLELPGTMSTRFKKHHNASISGVWSLSKSTTRKAALWIMRYGTSVPPLWVFDLKYPLDWTICLRNWLIFRVHAGG